MHVFIFKFARYPTCIAHWPTELLQLGFRWAITPPGTGPSSFPAPVEAPPTWGLGLTCQWGKKMHSDTFNASQPSAYDSAWFTSMSVQQLHQFHIISHYSDTIQILFRSIQTHLLCPFSSFQEFLKVGEVGHSVGTGHHPCTSSCRRWRRARPCAWPLHPWYGPWYSIIRVIIWVLPFSIVI